MLLKDSLLLLSPRGGEISGAEAGGGRGAVDRGLQPQPEAARGSAPCHQSYIKGAGQCFGSGFRGLLD